MVIQETSMEPTLVTSFFWLVFSEDEILEHGKNKVKARIEVNELKWFPRTAQEAYRWYMYSPNAVNIRAKSGLVTICKVTNNPYESTGNFLNGEPMPEDWLYHELIDIQDSVDIEPDFDGPVVEGPFSAEFVIIPKTDYTLHDETKQVGAIHHGMMSPGEIMRLSGDRVIRHEEVYETPRQSKSAIPEIPRPIYGGVADLRLGSYGDDACFTCGHTGNPDGKRLIPVQATLAEST